ncbi:hypothetical protein NP233_g6937 [Leucocoprinus birnbaumii]|uniref:Nephrocystin 3-like N-terminal domain-containing protein n=1 Tax=Leucocoprinus birnbaumii TaxID=56174 RepID=A0AAD5VQA9_9AGAR|nr:hypothetical protein NP233_g6937 [Leucocoprinus birnbaumii]
MTVTPLVVMPSTGILDDERIPPHSNSPATEINQSSHSSTPIQVQPAIDVRSVSPGSECSSPHTFQSLPSTVLSPNSNGISNGGTQPITPSLSSFRTDRLVIEALKEEDKAYVLKSGTLMEAFINAGSQTRLSLPLDNPDRNLLLYQCCAYYRLELKVDAKSGSIHIYSTPTSHIPALTISELISLDFPEHRLSSPVSQTPTPESTGAHENPYLDIAASRTVFAFEPILQKPQSSVLDHVRLTGLPKEPPLSRPSDRLTAIRRARGWLREPRLYYLYYLWGLQGVGKTAVVKDIAHIGMTCGEVSLVIFTSHRPHSHSPGCRLLSFIAGEIARRDPLYENYFAGLMKEHPNLHETDISRQFELLIALPFGPRAAHAPLDHPRLMVIDDIDACDHGFALLECISRFQSADSSLQLLWAVSAKSEPPVFVSLLTVSKSLIVEIPSQFHSIEQTSEAFLLLQFQQIRDLHRIDEPWPSYEILLQLSDVITGSIDLASLIIRYIRDPLIGDPRFQLQRMLNILASATTAKFVIQTALLDLLYLDVMHRIPLDKYPTVKRILEAQDLSGDSSSTQTLAETCISLLISENDAYNGLRYLHPVLDIPSLEDSAHTRIKAYDRSFSSFLTDPRRSGDYLIDTSNPGQLPTAQSPTTPGRSPAAWDVSSKTDGNDDAREPEKIQSKPIAPDSSALSATIGWDDQAARIFPKFGAWIMALRA